MNLTLYYLAVEEMVCLSASTSKDKNRIYLLPDLLHDVGQIIEQGEYIIMQIWLCL